MGTRTPAAMKPITPYQRLLAATQQYVSRVANPSARTMWEFSKSDLDANLTLDLGILRAKVETANALGYDVHVVYSNGSLKFQYVQKPANIGYNIWYR